MSTSHRRKHRSSRGHKSSHKNEGSHNNEGFHKNEGSHNDESPPKESPHQKHWTDENILKRDEFEQEDLKKDAENREKVKIQDSEDFKQLYEPLSTRRKNRINIILEDDKIQERYRKYLQTNPDKKHQIRTHKNFLWEEIAELEDDVDNRGWVENKSTQKLKLVVIVLSVAGVLAMAITYSMLSNQISNNKELSLHEQTEKLKRMNWIYLSVYTGIAIVLSFTSIQGALYTKNLYGNLWLLGLLLWSPIILFVIVHLDWLTRPYDNGNVSIMNYIVCIFFFFYACAMLRW